MHVWMGECHVHAGISPDDIAARRAAHPGAEFLIHPECGCATSIVDAISAGAVDASGVQILSTEGMIRRPSTSPADEFIVATEVGILHRLRRENPTKRFYAANEGAVCAYMKVTTLPKVVAALERMQFHITVPADIAARARRALERMVMIGGTPVGRTHRALSPSPSATVDPGE
jgi:quinolinate synthase